MRARLEEIFWRIRAVQIFVLLLAVVSCSEEIPQNLPPSVKVGEAYGITRTAAIIDGEITLNGKGEVSVLQLKYGTVSGSEDSCVICNPHDTNPVIKLENLSPGTLYHYFLEAGNGSYLAASQVKSFETVQNSPPVLADIAQIYSGLLSGTFLSSVADDGGEDIIEKGVWFWVQKSEDNPLQGSEDGVKVLAYSSDSVSFHTKIDGLEANVIYCVQAFALSAAGEGRSNVIRFKTGEPIVVLDRAGTLAEVIGASEAVNLKRLSIKGDMNGSDFAFLRGILGGNPNHNLGSSSHLKGVLNTIDLSETNIVEGGTPYDGYRYTVKDAVSTGLFEGCVNLKEISLPKSAVAVESDAFEGCSGLEVLTIPENVSEISHSFGCAALRAVNVVKSNAVYCSKDGVLLSKDMSELVWWPVAKEYSDAFEWPQGLVKIGDYAFKEYGGTSVTLPETLKELGAYSFSYSALKSVAIPDGVTTLPKGLFQNSADLESVTVGVQMGYFSDYCFSGCNLQRITVGADAFLPYVSSKAFGSIDLSGCTLYVPKGCRKLYKSSSFWSQFGVIAEVE